MKPNLQQFYFLFRISDHKLFVEIKSRDGTLSVSEARDAFTNLLNYEDIVSELGFFSINIVTDQEKFKEIFEDTQKPPHLELKTSICIQLRYLSKYCVAFSRQDDLALISKVFRDRSPRDWMNSSV